MYPFHWWKKLSETTIPILISGLSANLSRLNVVSIYVVGVGTAYEVTSEGD